MVAILEYHVYYQNIGEKYLLGVWLLSALCCTIFPLSLGMEWKSRQSMQRPNEQQQRLSSWAIN